MAHGAYRDQDDTDYYDTSYPLPDADATVFTVEGEFAVRYTRITGEWVRDRFESTTTPAITRGFYLQGVQTLTPRLFAVSRVTHASTPVLIGTERVQRTRSQFELSGGYRLTQDWILKGGYEASRRYGATDWDHAATCRSSGRSAGSDAPGAAPKRIDVEDVEQVVECGGRDRGGLRDRRRRLPAGAKRSRPHPLLRRTSSSSPSTRCAPIALAPTDTRERALQSSTHSPAAARGSTGPMRRRRSR